MASRPAVLAVAVAVLSGGIAATASAMPAFTSWGTAQKVDEIDGNSSELNTASTDGCPIQSPDGLNIYMASNRPGGHGGLDIWVAHRPSRDAPFGDPETLPAPINSPANDFCPTPVRGGRLFFVSNRVTAASCGLGDVYLAHRNPARGWSDAMHLACAPDGPNNELDEQGPSYVETDGGAQLYFSRSAPTVRGEIFVSAATDDGFGPAAPVSELNVADANDIQPNVRHDGLEVVFSSNRGATGGQDIYAATREDTDDPWSAPVNVGPGVNTGAAETRPSLSWDGTALLFGRTPGPEGPAGLSDIYRSTRARF